MSRRKQPKPQHLCNEGGVAIEPSAVNTLNTKDSSEQSDSANSVKNEELATDEEDDDDDEEEEDEELSRSDSEDQDALAIKTKDGDQHTMQNSSPTTRNKMERRLRASRELRQKILDGQHLDSSLCTKRTCLYCGIVKNSPADLARHVRKHTGEKPFACEVCHKAFKAKGSMLYHKKVAHGVNVELSQGLEERYLRLKTRAQLKNLYMQDHLLESEQKQEQEYGKLVQFDQGDFLDDIDGDAKSSDSFQLPESYLSTENVESGASFLKEEMSLSKSASDSSRLPEPLSALPDTEPGSTCYLQSDNQSGGNNSSGTLFKSAENFIITTEAQFTKNRISIKNETIIATRIDGINVDTGMKSSLFKCYICGKLFSYLSKLQCHLSLHYERHLVTYQCSFCSATFKFKAQLLQHTRRHMDLKDCVEPEVLNSSQVDQGIPQCSEEGKNTHAVSPFNSSLSDDRGVLGDDDPLRSASEYNTSYQNINMDSFSQRFMYPYQKVNGCYVCLYCRKSFTRFFSLQRHERVHTGYKPCYCKECGKGFSEYRNLRQHILRFHSDSYPMDYVRKVRKRAILASLKSSIHMDYLNSQQMASSSFEDNSEVSFPSEIGYEKDRQVKYPEDEERCKAKELLEKEGIKEDVTVVLPSDPPIENEDVGLQSHPSNGLPDGVWSENTSDNGDEDVQAGEIISAPKRCLLPHKRESLQAKSRRKASLTFRIDNCLQPMPINAEQELMHVEQNLVNSQSSLLTAMTTMGPISSVVMGSPSMSSQPTYLSGTPLLTTTVSQALAGSSSLVNIPLSLSVATDPVTLASLSASCQSPSPDRDTLVGLPRVQWHPPLSPESVRNAVLADGRKLTSLSRTHSRLHVVNSPVDREKVCKPTILPDGRAVYRCIFCGKDFLSFSDINRHMDFHEDIRPYKCKFCDYYARTNSQLKVHMMRHQGIREFCCKLCNYKGVTQSDLNRHMKSQIHMLKSRNECPHCGEGFVTSKNLEKHLESNCLAKRTKVENTE